jgi:hypothetical protein
MNSLIGTGRYTTVIPEVTSEIFDGELVVANYQSGVYYSISADGCWVWQGLAHGLTVPEIVNWLSNHFHNQTAELPALVQDFVGKLAAEGVILEAPKGDALIATLPVLTGSVFTEPTIDRFDDLQDLLMLDPVHDVDHTGWPRRPD